MDKRLFIQMNANRKITGVLRGFDAFMNIILDDVIDESVSSAKSPIGTCIIRGNSIVVMELLERIM